MARYESQTRVSDQRIDCLQCLHRLRDGAIEADTREVYQRRRENMTLFQAGGAVLRYRSEQRVAETVGSAESRVVQEEGPMDLVLIGEMMVDTRREEVLRRYVLTRESILSNIGGRGNVRQRIK